MRSGVVALFTVVRKLGRGRHAMCLMGFALGITLAALSLTDGRRVWAAATITFELTPAEPVAGQPVDLVVRTWVPDADGSPDRSRPMDMTGYPFDVRGYRAEEFPGGQAPATRGFPIELAQVDPFTWHATVVFPEPGSYVIVFRNWYPPLTVAPPPPSMPATIEVTVSPSAAPCRGSGSHRRDAAMP